MKDYDFAGKTVLITGGSMGIGAEFARKLSRRGARLVLSARSRDKLETLAAELGSDHHVIAQDLTQPGAPRRVFDAVTEAGLTIDVLINNAGFGKFGPFTELSLDVQTQEIDLNVRALVELTHLFLPMIERRQGGVIQVASTAAFRPVPYMAVYAASKAFVLSFSEALWAEHRPRGVRVLALCPGATDTPFFERAGEAAAFGKKASAEDVVKLGLKAFRANRASTIHGTGNFFTAAISRFVTRQLAAKVSERLMRPGLKMLPSGG